MEVEKSGRGKKDLIEGGNLRKNGSDEELIGYRS